MTDYPNQDAIREYVSFLFTVETIARDEHKRLRNNREISDLLLDSVLKITATHFGKMTDRSNGNFYSSGQQPPKAVDQPKNQPAQQVTPKQKLTDSVMDIVKAHPELEIDGERVVIRKKIESKKDYFDIKDELTKRGWKYIAPKHVGGDKWEPGYFEMEAERGSVKA